MIQVELHKVTPRLTKHAVSDTTYVRGLKREFDRLRDNALDVDVSHVIKLQPAKAHFTAITPDNTAEKDIADDLDYHDNRYSYFGPTIRSTTVRFGWESLTIAELRDLNRHRTGTKTFDLLPTGAYFADDQIDLIEPEFPDEAHRLRLLRHAGQDMIQFAMHQLKQSDPSFVYCLPIGTQCKYEHVTTADKFLYQSELRTGLGAHYSYAARMREVLEMWHKQFPSTRELIRPGTAEPE